MRDKQEAREQDEVGDDARSAVADERKRDPGQGDYSQDAADDDERLEREAEGQSDRKQLREAVLCQQRDPEAAEADEHVDQQDRRRSDEAELLRERRIDEVGREIRNQVVSVRRREHALTEAFAGEAPIADRVERLDDL